MYQKQYLFCAWNSLRASQVFVHMRRETTTTREKESAALEAARPKTFFILQKATGIHEFMLILFLIQYLFINICCCSAVGEDIKQISRKKTVLGGLELRQHKSVLCVYFVSALFS